jgi:hypothetical protein
MGGRTYIAPEVIGEVAHHAAIAKVEYAQIESTLKRTKYNDGISRHIARNAFVRYAWSLRRVVSPGDFDRFISSFAGSDTEDTSSIESILARCDFGVPFEIPGTGSQQAPAGLESRVRGVLARMARFRRGDADDGSIEQDKMDRDARSIVRYASAARGRSDVGSIMLLTSSKRLRIAVRRGAVGTRVFAAPASTLAMLLATVRSGVLTPTTLAQLLLAEGVREPVRVMQSELVRLLERADLLNALPQARLAMLEQEVKTAINAYAKKTARPARQVEREVLQASDKDALMEVVGSALRAVAIGAGTDALIRAQAEALAARSVG